MKDDPEILLSLYLNDNETMTDEQLHCLQEWINASPEHARQFVHTCYIHRLIHDHLVGTNLQKRMMISAGHEEGEYSNKDGYCEAAFWNALLQHEKNAETMVLPAKQQPRELITDVRRRKAMLKAEPPKIPAGLWVSLGALAALLLMITYVLFNPRIAEPVATLIDSYQACWRSKSLEIGDQLANTQEPIRLLSGCAKLQFDNGAEVILEGPVEFQLIGVEQMRVSEGKLTAIVPTTASGFRVDMPTMSVIDLGTEFSVKADDDGLSEIHLFRGKASLQIGEIGKRKDSHILTGGQARSVNPRTGQIEVVSLAEGDFVRRFDSEKGFVWRGEPMDLASIVAGGDGFNTIRGISGIDPTNGQRVTEYRITRHFSKGIYTLVPDNPFVDGVFFPDGGLGKTVISSSGHVFEECPDTEGAADDTLAATSHDILAFCDYDDRMIPELRKNKVPVFNGEAKGTAKEPAVLLHSNVGITFDLQSIRNRASGAEVTQFVSDFGMSSLLQNVRPKADVWLLVDGRLKFRQLNVYPETGVLNMSVTIAPSDQFLTIAVTDAGGYSDDYIYLINPRLILTGGQEKP